MKKHMIAILGTVTTIGVLAVGVWFTLFQPEPISAAEPKWLTDMQKAQELAAKEKKDLLINFTGSDWCSWCIRLKEEVFSQKEFEKAQDKFVLVEMDFPSDESIIPEKTREQNELWSNRFGIEGFPTIVLTDAQGRPYGSVGYVPGGPSEFLSQLDQTRKNRESRDEQLAKSKQAQGLEKAKLLASALETIPAEYHLPMYREEVQQIIALDSQDQAGLKSRFTKALQEAEAEEHLRKLQEVVSQAYSKDGEDAALKLVRDAFRSKDAKENPVLRSSLAQSEVLLLVKFDKTKEALARLDELAKDKTFSPEDRRSFQERQAVLFKESGETEKALKAYDALIAEVSKEKDSAEKVVSYLGDKAELLIEAERPDEALAVYDRVIEKAKKGSNEWLTAQLSRGNLLKETKKPKEAGAVFDEMQTVDTLLPVQKAMLLAYAAEAYHEAKDEEATAARVEKADKLLAELKKAEEVPPQFLEQLGTRLDAVRKDKKADPKTEDKPAKQE